MPREEKYLFKTMKSVQFSMFKRPGMWMAPVLLVTALYWTGCKGGGAAEGETVINGTLTGCNADSMRLYEVTGTRINKVAAVAIEKGDKESTFSLHYKFARPGFYLLGDDARRGANLVLGDQGAFELTGDCQNPQTYKLEAAPLNDAYGRLQSRVNNHNQQLQGLYQNLQIFAQSDPMQVQRIQEDIAKLNQGHFGYLDSMEAAGGFMGKVAKMYNFKPFGAAPSHGQYGNELEYFRQTFFANLDFADAEIASLPQLYDKARAFSATLAGQNMPKEVIKSSLDAVLGKTQSGSVAHESLLRGFVAGMEQSKSPLLVEYGKAFINTYPNSDPQYIASLNAAIGRLEAMADGAMAPDIEGPTPDGKTMKLSDFRGKVVMIDFWASWCRPCRMENPNVLKAYNKYHPKGFEILGVSLDQERNKWTAAIQQDGLIWQHISDLRGWQSQPAGVYGVNSIPATVLVDKEGKIIARNLRGPALEEKLKEIFGS
jgi:peroxiredoxin